MSELKLSPEEFAVMRDFVERECGISLAANKSYLIETRLSALVVKSGCTSYAGFYQRAKGPDGAKLRDQIVDAMTTNETLWFRDSGPWEILRKVLVPAFCERLQRSGREKIRIWSAACSTGQEPYSIAMLLRDHIAEHKPQGVTEADFEIVATDISHSALFVAQAGRYDRLAASRGLDPKLRERHFRAEGNAVRVLPEVSRMVHFKRLNLMEPIADLGRFDLVLCRNVLIYFAPASRKEVLKKLAKAMRPGASLIIGASESLQDSSEIFRLVEPSAHALYTPVAGALK